MVRSCLKVTLRYISFGLAYNWRELENEVVVEISLYYLFGIEVIVFDSVFLDILGDKLSNLRHSCFVLYPEFSEWKFSFMDWPYPWGVEVEDCFWSVDGDLPEVFLPVRNTFIQATHHLEVIELRAFREVCPVFVSFLDVEIVVECSSYRAFFKMNTNCFKCPKYPPAVRSDLARSNEEVIEDIFYKRVKG